MNEVTLYRLISEEEKDEMNECIKFPERLDDRKELLNSFNYGNIDYYNDPRSRRKHFFIFKDDLEKYKKIYDDKYVGVYTFPQDIVKNNLGIGFYPENNFYPIEVAIKSKDIKELVDYNCPKQYNSSSTILTEYADIKKIFKGIYQLEDIKTDYYYDLFEDDIKDVKKILIDLYFEYNYKLSEYKKGNIELSEVTEVLSAIKNFFETDQKENVMQKILSYK